MRWPLWTWNHFGSQRLILFLCAFNSVGAVASHDPFSEFSELLVVFEFFALLSETSRLGAG